MYLAKPVWESSFFQSSFFFLSNKHSPWFIPGFSSDFLFLRCLARSWGWSTVPAQLYNSHSFVPSKVAHWLYDCLLHQLLFLLPFLRHHPLFSSSVNWHQCSAVQYVWLAPQLEEFRHVQIGRKYFLKVGVKLACQCYTIGNNVASHTEGLG